MSNEVLAVVAGREITEADVQNLINNYPPEQRVYLTGPNARPELVEQLISFHLFAKMAEDEKIDQTDEYKAMLDKVKVELASHLAVTKVMKEVTVSAEEESKYYQEHQDEFVQAAAVRAKHILVETEEKANEVAKEIEAGKSFEDAAKEHSTCPSKDRGGDLGFFTKGQMVPEFEKAAFEAELNTVIGPVQTQFGFHLIKAEEKKEEQVTPFEMVQPQIHDQLVQLEQQKVYAEKIKELEGKYGVERK